jgi:hypothetical protein
MLLLLVFFASFVATSESEQLDTYPSVSIQPKDLSAVRVGETFTVSVVVSGLKGNNLYGFDIKFKWNTDVLEYVSHEVKVPVETCSEGVLHKPILEIENQIDTVAGTYWLACASLSPAEPFNEDGVFFTLTFVLLKESDNPSALESVILADYKGEMIPVNGFQNSETSLFGTLSSYEMTEARESRCKKWLEWWITITQQFSKRRCPTG